MKKTLFAIISLLLCFSLLFAACDEGSVDESSKAQSDVTLSGTISNSSSQANKPWYDTSVPENYVSHGMNYSSASSEIESEASSEVSDDSSEKSDDTTSGILDIEGVVTDFPSRAATSYRIAYTKSSALNAIDCVTNVGMSTPVTAIFDGSVTRFFHATKGTFYNAVPGKYLYPCCEGFLSGDSSSFDGNYAVMFEFDDEDEPTITNEHFGHGGFGNVYDFYSETDGCAYMWFSDIDGTFFARYMEDNLVICREYIGNQDITNAFENDELLVTDSDLGKYGLIKNDNVIIPFEYDYMVTVYGANDVGVVLAKRDGRSYYFSTNGTNLTPDGFDCGSQPYNNRAWVFEDGQGYILEFR